MASDAISLSVLTLIGQQGPMPRSEIAQTLRLNPTTVTKTVGGLLEKKLVNEMGLSKSTGGRRSALLELREGSYALCGIELSFSSRVRLAVTDLRANILAQSEFQASPDTPLDELLDLIKEALQKCFSNDPKIRSRLKGIGIGVAGLVDSEAGISHNCQGFPLLREAPLAEKLSAKLGYPTYIDNDVDLSTMAELWFGSGRGRSHFLYISMDAGLGMGIVLNGNLYRGQSGNAGEIGHIVFEEHGPMCYCGNSGCLERYVSTEKMLAEARSAISARSFSHMAGKFRNNPEQIQMHDLYEAMRQGDRFALSLLEKACHPMGLTLANLVNVFDVELIIIGGNMAQAGDAILDLLGEQIRKRSASTMSGRVSLKLAAMGSLSTAIGGAALVLNKICEGAIAV